MADRPVEQHRRGAQPLAREHGGRAARTPASRDEHRRPATLKLSQRGQRAVVDALVAVPQRAVEIGDDQLDVAQGAATSSAGSSVTAGVSAAMRRLPSTATIPTGSACMMDSPIASRVTQSGNTLADADAVRAPI